jgi:hypothetical protein
VDGLLEIFNLAAFLTSTADVFDGVAKVEVQSLITNEVTYGPIATVVFRTLHQ